LLLIYLDFGKMKQGDVLVAVTTTPAWTSLFTLATGIARRRIHVGQTVTVDGSAGTVGLK
jgi:hypothetical protein